MRSLTSRADTPIAPPAPTKASLSTPALPSRKQKRRDTRSWEFFSSSQRPAASASAVISCAVMKDFYIRDCAEHENQVITSSFVVASKQIKSKKTGEPYLALSLSDRSGQVEGKVWDNVNDFINAFDQDDVVKVKGLLNRFNQRWQLTLHKLRRMEETEIDFADYLPKTTKDIEQLWRELVNFVAEFKNPYLKNLVEAFMADAEIAAAYKCAPAAKSLHHAFIGGLLEHAVSPFELCHQVARPYPHIDSDPLLTCAFLHH